MFNTNNGSPVLFNGYKQPQVVSSTVYLLPVPELRKLAEKGDPNAQVVLGRILLKGFLGCNKNIPEGESWIIKASRNPNAKDPAVLCAKGLCQFLALGGIQFKNKEEAKCFFMEAINQNYVPAKYELARLLYEEEAFVITTLIQSGKRVTQEQPVVPVLKDIINLFNDAANAKYAPAIEYLAHCYHWGDGVAKDRNESLRLFRMSVDGKDNKPSLDSNSSGYAKKMMGDFYRNGWGGIKKDNAEAKRWYRAARDQGADIGNSLSSGCTLM